MVRWCWVNFQCWGVLLIWIRVGQGPTALAVGAGGGCLDIFFSLVYRFSFLSPSLLETARYRLKYCLKGPLSPKQPTNRVIYCLSSSVRNLKIIYEMSFNIKVGRNSPSIHQQFFVTEISQLASSRTDMKGLDESLLVTLSTRTLAITSCISSAACDEV